MILKHLVLIAIGIANVSAADDVHATVTTEDTQTNLRATATASDNERELVDTIATADLDVVSPADDMKLTDENKVRSTWSYDGISSYVCAYDMFVHMICLCIMYVHMIWFFNLSTA